MCHAQSGPVKSPHLVLLELERIAGQQRVVLASLSVDTPEFSNTTLVVALGVEQSLRNLTLLGRSHPQLLHLAVQQTIALTRLAVLDDTPQHHARRDWTTWARYLAATIQQGLSRAPLDFIVYSSRSPARH